MPSNLPNNEAPQLASAQTPEKNGKSATSKMSRTIRSMMFAGLGLMGTANAGEITVKLGGSRMVDGQGQEIVIEGQKFHADDKGKGKQLNAVRLLEGAMASTARARQERDEKFYAALEKMRPARPPVIIQQVVVPPEAPVVTEPAPEFRPRLVLVGPDTWVGVKDPMGPNAFRDFDNRVWVCPDGQHWFQRN